MPLGEIDATIRGDHIRAYVMLPKSPEVHYLRFTVNDTLGRIDCAAEPSMVYKKAEIHALTNSPLSDPLTGKTGSEEALSILSSGVCQPWKPLTPAPILTLHSISRLSPKREYYPEDRKLMAKETWLHNIPSSTQREEYSFLVDRILRQSARLSSFYAPVPQGPPPISSGDSHLNQRALLRRQLHRRPDPAGLPTSQCQDLEYRARDRPSLTGLRYANVFAVMSLIRERPASMNTMTDLIAQLSQCLSIKGYPQALDKTTLSDRLGLDVRQYWGPLVKTVRDMPNQYSLMFFLAVIAFRADSAMPLIRTLVAIYLYSELRSMELPTATEYHSIQRGQAPQLEVLIKLMGSFKIPVPEVRLNFYY